MRNNRNLRATSSITCPGQTKTCRFYENTKSGSQLFPSTTTLSPQSPHLYCSNWPSHVQRREKAKTRWLMSEYNLTPFNAFYKDQEPFFHNILLLRISLEFYRLVVPDNFLFTLILSSFSLSVPSALISGFSTAVFSSGRGIVLFGCFTPSAVTSSFGGHERVGRVTSQIWLLTFGWFRAFSYSDPTSSRSILLWLFVP